MFCNNILIRIITVFIVSIYANQLFAVTDLPEKNYGPSRGRIPYDYYKEITKNTNNKSVVKEWANLAINHFLDEKSPLPKNISGIFRDEQGNDAPELYRSKEGGDDLMWALFQVYKKYPDDTDAQGYYQHVINFADEIVLYGTDRYGSVATPLISSILTRDSIPGVPEDPENAGHGVKIEKHSVYSFDTGGMRTNWMAVGIGNIWYGSDESHKSSWHGSDMAVDEKLYALLYELSEFTGDSKYKDAADASISYWLGNCVTENNLFPWGEHAGWNFFTDSYDQGWYHAKYHEFKGGGGLYDKFIELQPRVRKGEFTVMEEYAFAQIATGTGKVQSGNLEGMFIYGRHQPLWSNRISATNDDPDLVQFGMFPRIPGSMLYLHGITYNRSFNPEFRDSVISHMDIIVEGLEQQRTLLNTNYYPYTNINSATGAHNTLKNQQNGDLGSGALRTALLLEDGGVQHQIINKLKNVAAVTGTNSNYIIIPYHGPSMVTAIIPEENSYITTSEIKLEWGGTAGVNSYNIYFSENMDELRTATEESNSFLGNSADNSFQLSALSINKEYFWVIDAIGENGIRKGEINRFYIGDSSGIIPVTGIDIIENAFNLEIGESIQLRKTVFPENASNKRADWSSEKPSIATVNKFGEVKAVDLGETYIYAKTVDGNFIDSVHLSVTEISLNSIEITPEVSYLDSGDSLQLIVQYDPENANNQSVTWSSDNPAIASVDSTGMVIANSSGLVFIRARSTDENISDYAIIHISNDIIISLNGIEITPAVSYLDPGDSLQLTIQFNPENASDKNITWSSDNPDVASVNSTGKVMANSSGVVYIRARSSDNSISDYSTINVNEVTSVKEIDNSKIRIYPNPFSERIIIESDKMEGMIMFCDIDGRVLVKESISKTPFSINTSNLIPGVYFACLRVDKKIITHKLVKH